MPRARDDVPWAEVEALWVEGRLTINALASRYNVHPNTVRRHAKKGGWPPRGVVAPTGDAPAQTDMAGPQDPLAALVARLYGAVARQLDELEHQLAAPDPEHKGERLMRTVNTMAHTLSRLQQLEAKLERLPASTSGERISRSNAGGALGSGAPETERRAALRAEMERRLARLLEQRSEDGVS